MEIFNNNNFTTNTQLSKKNKYLFNDNFINNEIHDLSSENNNNEIEIEEYGT